MMTRVQNDKMTNGYKNKMASKATKAIKAGIGICRYKLTIVDIIQNKIQCKRIQ